MTGRTRARRALAALIGAVLALVVLGALAALLRSDRDLDRLVRLAKSDEEVRREAIRELVAGGQGVWDAHLDPDVGRVLQPDLEGRPFRGAEISSNARGMREAAWETPKPDGVVRVVLLGDSMVFGLGVAAEERLGVFLARFLNERSANPGARVECLHLGISSWDIVAECAYVRRQLRFLRPDLVVQVVVVNDLNDTRGVRGFGSMGFYSAHVRERANGVVGMLSHPSLWPEPVPNHLIDGLDHESRARYARAAEDIAELAAAVERTGGRYLLVGSFGRYNPMVHRHLAKGLRPDQVAYLSSEFSDSPLYTRGSGDTHWNPDGHRRVAQLLYGLAVERDLLPACAPRPWPEASEAVDRIHAAGLRAAEQAVGWDAALAARARRIRSWIDFAAVDEGVARQVHGGVDGEGFAAPYASMIVAVAGGSTLRLRAARLDAPELEGGRVRVFLDEVEVGEIPLAGDEEVSASWALPAALEGRAFLSVRLAADDYVYKHARNHRCVCLRLRSVSIE